MFFRKPKVHICVVCGKVIEPKAQRFVEKNRITKVEQHAHIGCRNLSAVRSGEASHDPQ